MLNEKRLIITGVVNDDSIAFTAARKALISGAEVLLTAFPRDRDLTLEAAAKLPGEVEVVELDVTSAEDHEALAARVDSKWGALDGVLHAVAFAPRDALAGDFFDTRPEGLNLAFHTSAYSYASLGKLLRDFAPPEGGSLVGLDFDSAGAWPVYNWMGVIKAGLESVNRYVARDLGPLGIRANLIAAGPLHTRAAGGIPSFEKLIHAWETRAPHEVGSLRPGPGRRRGRLPALRSGPGHHRRDPPCGLRLPRNGRRPQGRRIPGRGLIPAGVFQSRTLASGSYRAPSASSCDR